MVTGAGLVGSAVAAEALAAGHPTVVVAASDAAAADGAVLVGGRVGEGVLANVLADGDLLILAHGAASPRAAGPAADALLDRVDAASEDVRAAVERVRDIDLVFFSSGGTVYAPSESPLTEGSPLAPESPYAKAKLHEESALLALNELSSARATALRVSTVFGLRPGGSATQGLVQIAADCLRAGEPVRLFGDGTVRRGYVWNRDLGRIAVQVGLRSGQDPLPEPVYNLCSERYLSGVEVVRAVAGVLGVEPAIEFVDRPDRDVLLSAARLRREAPLDFTAFETALQAMF